MLPYPACSAVMPLGASGANAALDSQGYRRTRMRSRNLILSVLLALLSCAGFAHAQVVKPHVELLDPTSHNLWPFEIVI